ncbi:MAG: ATP-binding cassette domain-containing protein [Deltaproteobacteria bacterium]|nr:ATP-binding cassette domain-containing protein [Deltaproteobacteria bacterium]
MSEPIYKLENLIHRYTGKTALLIESLTIDEGSIIGVAGPNGSGKSTLLKILAFLLAPTEGEVYFKGELADLADRRNRLEATLLLQDPYLLKRSVFENVAYGLRLRREKIKLKERVYEALEYVGLAPDDFAERTWRQLSGGEAQRVALASRLALKPKVLLLDEPLVSVDAASAERIKQASVKARSDWGTSLVIVSHDSVWLNETADRVLNLFEGRVLGSGTWNLIPGPWQGDDRGTWVRRLEDGQEIFAIPPRTDKRVATLDPSSISVSIEGESPGSSVNRLRGMVSEITLEKKSGHVLVKAEIGGQFFVVRVTKQEVRDLSLYPGELVWYGFEPTAVQWV